MDKGSFETCLLLMQLQKLLRCPQIKFIDMALYISGQREMLLTDTTPPAPANQNQPGVDIVQQHPVSDDDLQDADPADISTADFIILQSSFECK